MNLRMFLSSLTFTLLLSANFVSAQNGTWVTDKRNHTDFKAISFETAGDVYIYLSDRFSVEVEGNPATTAKITTEVSNKTLYIRNKQQYFNWNSKKDPLKIRIKLPLLEKLDMSGSGDVEVKGLIRNPRLDVNLSGSSDVLIEKIAVRDLQLQLSGSGQVQFGSGNVDSGDLHLSGSGTIMARNLQITDGRANLSGSGQIEIWAKRYLDIDLGGSGTVAYRGNPQIAKDVDGSGSVKRIQ